MTPKQRDTSTRIRRARIDDGDALVVLQREFYVEDRIAQVPANARALRRLLRTPEAGGIWVIETVSGGERTLDGYIVLTVGYSLERGGRDAFIDELFVRAVRRGRGLGAQAVAIAEAGARRRGVRAVHLEVDHTNERARRLYERVGFTLRQRYQLMTKVL